jgi:NAD-dependent dihydropyrimidine dehydrogenase PreA subunit
LNHAQNKIKNKEELKGMTYVITEPCIDVKDTACVDVCPVDCIHPTSSSDNFENVNQLFIDPEECIDCGVCEPECPVEAIFMDEDVPAEWEHFTQLNADYFK